MKHDLSELLRRKAAEAEMSAPSKRRTYYQDVPEAVRPQNPLSGRAEFLPCRYRRRGYMLKVPVVTWAEGLEVELSEQWERILLDRWYRGAHWVPPVVQVREVEGKGEVVGQRGTSVLRFLAGRKAFASVQLLEWEDPQADAERGAKLVELLQARGLPVVQSRITY